MIQEKILNNILNYNKSVILTAKFKPNDIGTKHIGMINGSFIYILINKGIFIYIGCSSNLGERLCNHKRTFEFNTILVLKYKNRKSAFFYEKEYIKIFKPKHNFKYNEL